jgi:hypothetical protein
MAPHESQGEQGQAEGGGVMVALKPDAKLEHDLARALHAQEETNRTLRAAHGKALRMAQDRIAALEAELSAWKAEPLVTRILRAWRGI